MIAEACDERSPGVILNWFYVDSSHLQQLHDDPAIYSSSEVNQKINEQALDDLLFSTRPERRHRSSVRDLVIISGFTSGMIFLMVYFLIIYRLDSFPTDDAPLSHDLIEACAHVKGSLWENLAVSLIEENDIQYAREHIRHDFARMVYVLKLWNTAKSPKVGTLLAWFKKFGVSRSSIESQYKDLPGRK